jgi:hypothetical protein
MMNTMTMAVAAARLDRDSFSTKRVVVHRESKKVAWPRKKGPKAIRIEVKTQHAVGFVN